MRSERSEHREAQQTGFMPLPPYRGPAKPIPTQRAAAKLALRIGIAVAFGIASGCLILQRLT